MQRHRLVVEKAREGTERSCRAYVCPLTTLMAFNYLGNIITASENDWLAVVANLRKAWKKCSRMSRILGREGSDVQMSEPSSRL